MITGTTTTSGGRITIAEPETPDVLKPFYITHINYREALARLVSSLTDEELTAVYDLFDRTNHANIPIEFWFLAPKVRVLIQAEQKRRAEREANLVSLTGEPTA